MEGAAGLCFDNGIYLFASWVEGEVNAAADGAANDMFARSAKERAFARCMGDDMATSSAGYADPFAVDDPNFVGPDAKRKRRIPKAEDGEEVLWSEA